MTYNGADIITEISPFGLNGVLVEYFKKGYEKPCDGDRVVVEARVSLPTDKESIRDDYIYGEGINFFGKPLVASWGQSLVQGRRTFTMQIKADSFEEGFTEARTIIELELSKFQEVIKEREQKLSKY